MNRKISYLIIFFILNSCTSSDNPSAPSQPATTLTLSMTRIPQVGLDPFQVDVAAQVGGVATAGLQLTLNISNGTVSGVTDQGNGTYSFIVTPSNTGVYPVQVSVNGTTIIRKAVVLDTYATGVGQPMTIPGDYLNTEGYEDGVTVTPDGQYLFVQYGPLYFSGLFNITTVCSSGAYSIGYDLNNCAGRANSDIVFNTIGPYNNYLRPSFPAQAITAGKFNFLPGVVLGGLANGLGAFPTIFYGFKKQTDGTFAEPFRLAFDDSKGSSGPYGLSFKMNGDGTGIFLMAWNNYFNDLGDDKADIYTGSITFGIDNTLGTVTYGSAMSGDMYQSITPNVTAVGFTSHAGTQGNPHLYSDQTGVIKSIWTDDETTTKDLSVYRLTAGTFPTGTWVKDTLPSVINTAAEEDQPFFTGDKLIFSRDGNIVYHSYQPTNGTCASTYTHNDCWGAEVILVGANGHTSAGEIFIVGEPTVAEFGGKKYLYFVFVKARETQNFTGIVDFNLDPAFVEIP